MEPVLVGNRRQGPDLANVGNRRHREWERLHLQDPRSLSPGSTMPSYRRLFARGDARGEDLLDYLDSLGRGTGAERYARVSTWSPPPDTLSAGDAARGRRVFGEHCSPCHGDEGRGDGPLAPRVERPAMNLRKGAPLLLPTWGETANRNLALARLVRFGAPGTPMPGHETLSDAQVADLVALVVHWLDEDAAGRPAPSAGVAP
ncbi:MAG: cbb3-type cytochrome c oxidase subunit II [Thermoanaerobaculia bacterium]